MLLADLSGLFEMLRSGWVGPAFMILFIVLAVTFLVKRQTMAFVSFLAFAMVIGIAIFRTESFVGENGVLTDVGTNFGTTAFN